MFKPPADFEDKVRERTEMLLRHLGHDPDRIEQGAIKSLSSLSRMLSERSFTFDTFEYRMVSKAASSRMLRRLSRQFGHAVDLMNAGATQFVLSMRSTINILEWTYEQKGESASPLLREFHDRASRLTEKELNDPAALERKLLKGLDAFEARSVHHRLKNFKP